jgi:hypothetical protein
MWRLIHHSDHKNKESGNPADQNISGRARKHRTQLEVVISVTQAILVTKVTMLSRKSTITVLSNVT